MKNVIDQGIFNGKAEQITSFDESEDEEPDYFLMRG
jgi:hypothetical protein